MCVEGGESAKREGKGAKWDNNDTTIFLPS